MWLMAIAGCVHAPKKTSEPEPTQAPAAVSPPQLTWDFVQASEDGGIAGSPFGFTINADENHADLNDLPIRVWAIHGADGGIVRLREVGHGPKDCCAQVSALFLTATSNPEHLNGFLTYGAADIAPVPGNATGVAALQTLTDSLRAVASQPACKAYVGVVDVPFGDLDVVPEARPDVGNPQERLALTGIQGPSPAFLPLVVLTPDGGTKPLEFELTIADLRISQNLFENMTKDVGLAPWLEAVSELRGLLRNLEELIGLRNTLKELEQLFSDKVWTYQLSGFSLKQNPVGVSDDVRAMIIRKTATDENIKMDRLRRKYNTLRVLYRFQYATNFSEYDKPIAELSTRIASNAACMAAPLRCTEIFDVKLIPDDSGKSRSLDAEIDSMKKIDPKELKAAKAELTKRLKAAMAVVEERRKAPPLAARSRERLIDALLRGWRIAAREEKDEAALVQAVDVELPAAWAKLTQRIETESGVVLRDGELVGGLLNRTNVFFRVQEVSNGRFKVRPTYVVWRNYMKIWDPERHLVTIETPYGQGFLTDSDTPPSTKSVMQEGE